MNVLMFPPTHGSGLGEQFRQTTAALADQGVSLTFAADRAFDFKPDVIQLFDAPDIFQAISSFVRAREVGAPVVVNPIYWNPNRFYDQGLPEADPPRGDGAELEQQIRNAARGVERAVQRVLFCHAAVLIAVTPSEAELLARDFGVDPARIAIAVDGVIPLFARATPDAFWREYGDHIGGMRDFVLCAARVEIRKNQLNLIRALRAEPLTLVFAGEILAPAYRAACETAARGGQVRVFFLSSLAPPLLASAYAAARVHALASWYDNFGLTPLEAAVAGCSLALSQECGARDYLQNDAHYFDPANLDEIRTAVLAAMDTRPAPMLRERLLKEYTWARCAEQTRAAYAHAQRLQNPRDDDAYRTDLENALVAFANYARLQQRAHDELWREKSELVQQRDAYANGRVMRVLNELTRLFKHNLR